MLDNRSEIEMGFRKLFHVDDTERPMYIVAADWTAALEAWRSQVSAEADVAPEETPEPDGIYLVCGSDDLLITESIVDQMIPTL